MFSFTAAWLSLNAVLVLYKLLSSNNLHKRIACQGESSKTLSTPTNHVCQRWLHSQWQHRSRHYNIIKTLLQSVYLYLYVTFRTPIQNANEMHENMFSPQFCANKYNYLGGVAIFGEFRRLADFCLVCKAGVTSVISIDLGENANQCWLNLLMGHYSDSPI